MRLTRDLRKIFRKISKFFPSFLFFFMFPVEKDVFLLFLVGEEWFSRFTHIPSAIFGAVKLTKF